VTAGAKRDTGLRGFVTGLTPYCQVSISCNCIISGYYTFKSIG
jgi:hypothetical protein